jgi:outer membrane receptor for ferrienterochelin and colicins
MKLYLLLITLLFTIGTSSAQQNKGVITGKILTEKGLPVSGALIEVQKEKLAVYSKDDGTFRLTAPVGKVKIVVSATEYRSFATEVTLNAAQESTLGSIRLKPAAEKLEEVVITGQYEPQSLKNSVYQTRIINGERIRLRAATNIQQVLSTELGFRFSNDMTLGTSDIYMMGMSGRNVKILLDGVPLIDRGDTRESLNQIDINTIERIEIVEGPLSVSYGSDALAGVVNIITKNPGKSLLNISARVQEETAGKEYDAFRAKGNHLQNLSASWQNKGWSALIGATHNEFGGWNQAAVTAAPEIVDADVNRWKPKTQWMGNAKLGYQNDNFKVSYLFNGLDETLDARGGMNPNNFKARNQKYITNRYTQQLQGEWRLNPKLQLSGVIGYSDLQRKTKTVIHDFTNNTESLSTGAGEQDVSKFNSVSARTTAQYKLSEQVKLQPGIEINLDQASGARIKGDPKINDYAFFISSEINLIKGINLRPGLRFIKNSVYDAPPVIPSINAKIELLQDLDLRLGYARGFRAPALRELYYDFFDASHSIMGNPNLKAEESDSYTAALSWASVQEHDLRLRSTLNGFYNNFKNRIEFGQAADNPSITTMINISKYKTTGGTFENTLFWKDFQATVGFSYIGTYNKYSESEAELGKTPQFVWAAELNSNLIYTFKKIGTSINLAYKYSGKRPVYELFTENNVQRARLATTAAFNMADLMVSKIFFKQLTLNAGVKNMFNVTTLASNSLGSGGAHSTGGGAVPLSYGRSYVFGISYNWSKL